MNNLPNPLGPVVFENISADEDVLKTFCGLSLSRLSDFHL
jgi:hypothetical protein